MQMRCRNDAYRMQKERVRTAVEAGTEPEETGREPRGLRPNDARDFKTFFFVPPFSGVNPKKSRDFLLINPYQTKI